MPDWQLAARRAANRHGVDPKILVALINQESGGRENVTSPAGARDIAQFMPATAKGYGVTLGDNRISDDLDGAARYLAANLKRTGGDYKAALSIYNSGRPDGYKSIPETKNYVAKIIANAGSYPAGGGVTQAASTTRTVKGVPVTPGGEDRSQLLAQYLLNRNRPGSLMSLAGELGSLKAPVTKTTIPGAVQSSPSMAGGKSKLLELFWQGAGGINMKNGAVVPQGFVSGHTDHVHVAAGPKTTVELGRLAQSMGLHVGENPTFGKVNPVHVANSYHYKGEAIDVSGDPAKMRAFAHRVARMYGAK